jgi:hypothetical protein
MTTIEDMLEAVEKVDMQYEAETALLETRPEFLAQQREQLLSGLRSDDQNIYNIKTGRDYYSDSYTKVKGKRSPIDLYRTGEWSRGIFVDVRSEFIIIDSTDSKQEKLTSTYGEEILGLGTRATENYMPDLEDTFSDNMEKRLS